jgi:hypothetical protein
MNAAGRVPFVICACLLAGASAVGQSATDSGGPPPQPSAASPQAVSQAQGVAPADTSTPPAPTADTRAQQTGIAASPVITDPKDAASKPGRKVLVDDTVNDAQLKQIRAKGYQPEAQARGNQVYYCRSDHELGSRFATKTCKTAQRILQDELQGKEATATFQQRNEDRMQK